MTDVMARVEKHYERAVEHYGVEAVLGVFHYGSFNYGTNTENSDVDTKCILVPNLHSLAIHPYEVTHLAVDDEVCECMSIMHMVNNWKKQNINFLEIMFTKYYILNPMYENIWNKEFSMLDRELVARYDPKVAVLSMAHQAIHTLKQDPNDLKKIMNGARIANALSKLTSSEPKKYRYKEVIQVDKNIAGIRTGEIEVPDGFVHGLITFFEVMIDRANANEWTTTSLYKAGVQLIMENLIIKLIKARLEEEKI